jgi:hypothetical protein
VPFVQLFDVVINHEVFLGLSVQQK